MSRAHDAESVNATPSQRLREVREVPEDSIKPNAEINENIGRTQTRGNRVTSINLQKWYAGFGPVPHKLKTNAEDRFVL